MEKFFRTKNKLWITIASIVLLVVLLAFIIVEILAICNVGILCSTSPISDIIATIVMFIVIALLIIFIFTSGYSIKEDGLHIRLGFFINKIPYEKILMARFNSKKTMLLLYVETNIDNADVKDGDIKANILQIHIDKSKVDSFISSLKNYNKMMVVEIKENEVQ